jgi:hypothetical protein
MMSAMAARSPVQGLSEITELEVRQQLDRLLNSKTFQNVHRLRRD